MATSVAKIIKGSISNVAAHRQAQERAWGIYTAGMARLQSEYMERCRLADETFFGAPEPDPAQPEQPSATNGQSEQPTTA